MQGVGNEETWHYIRTKLAVSWCNNNLPFPSGYDGARAKVTAIKAFRQGAIVLYEMRFYLVLYSYGRAMDCTFFEKLYVAEHLARFIIERAKTESHKL